MEVGCLGRIVEHERLPDGRFYLLLQGCKRVRLDQELPSPKLYRIARATILEDQDPSIKLENRREELIDLFLQSFDRPHPLDADLSRMMNSDVPLGVLTDFIAHILELTAWCKQSLLEETRGGESSNDIAITPPETHPVAAGIPALSSSVQSQLNDPGSGLIFAG